MSPSAPRFFLAYDSECGPCSSFKAAVELLDARNRIEFVTLEVADGSGLVAGIAPASRYASFHLVGPVAGAPETDVLSGSEALLPLIRILSPWRVVSRVGGGFPLSARAASFAYSALSRLPRSCSAARGPHSLSPGRPGGQGGR